jgi:hypothetical protein
MASGTYDNTSQYGLQAYHIYTTLGTAVYRNEKLIKLRNPYGNENFSGPWSDGDNRWTADAKSRLGHSAKNDGTFWMRFSDFHRLFKHTTVGMYYNWNRDSAINGWDRTTNGLKKL